MTEAQLQLVLQKIEGVRQQLSAFCDVILYEIKVERLRERAAADVKPR
jgi:hypothetical protein